MNEEQKAWANKVKVICDDAMSGKIPTYEDLVTEIEKAIETCPEP